MNRLPLLGLAALALAAAPHAQTVTGLDGWSLYLDPGHSQTENDGIFGYSEAEKVVRVGLALREMLLTRTDIDTVYLSRTNDQEQVSLSQRTDEANALGADFFHSIHSNAAAPDVNNVLMLYGGWREDGETVEKTPEGGARMGAEYLDALSRAMRLPTAGQGNFADRTFYLGFPNTHDRLFPYLFVNRTTTMASVLSEGGFHTNPRQNQLNMNAEWKRLEAQAHYWAILDWHGVPRSTHRIATGIVTDAESGRPINGAVVTVSGKTYTTDTFESLFNQFSDDPDELSNGFYYLEGVDGGVQTVTASAPDYRTATVQVTVQDTTFSFADVALVSTVAPVVTDARPADGAETFPITDPLRLTFSRPLDPETAASAVTLVPTAGGAAVEGAVTLADDGYTLVFTPAAPLAPRTAYTLTVAGTATTVSGDALDGDGDGTGGDAFSLSFMSSFADTAAPRLSQSFPAPNAQGAGLESVVTVAFDEPVVPATLDGRVTLEAVEGGGGRGPGGGRARRRRRGAPRAADHGQLRPRRGARAEHAVPALGRARRRGPLWERLDQPLQLRVHNGRGGGGRDDDRRLRGVQHRRQLVGPAAERVDGRHRHRLDGRRRERPRAPGPWRLDADRLRVGRRRGAVAHPRVPRRRAAPLGHVQPRRHAPRARLRRRPGHAVPVRRRRPRRPRRPRSEPVGRGRLVRLAPGRVGPRRRRVRRVDRERRVGQRPAPVRLVPAGLRRRLRPLRRADRRRPRGPRPPPRRERGRGGHARGPRCGAAPPEPRRAGGRPSRSRSAPRPR